MAPRDRSPTRRRHSDRARCRSSARPCIRSETRRRETTLVRRADPIRPSPGRRRRAIDLAPVQHTAFIVFPPCGRRRVQCVSSAATSVIRQHGSPDHAAATTRRPLPVTTTTRERSFERAPPRSYPFLGDGRKSTGRSCRWHLALRVADLPARRGVRCTRRRLVGRRLPELDRFTMPKSSRAPTLAASGNDGEDDENTDGEDGDGEDVAHEMCSWRVQPPVVSPPIT